MCTVHTPKGKSTRTSTSLMEPYVWYYSFWHFVFMEPKVTVLNVRVERDLTENPSTHCGCNLSISS